MKIENDFFRNSFSIYNFMTFLNNILLIGRLVLCWRCILLLNDLGDGCIYLGMRHALLLLRF